MMGQQETMTVAAKKEAGGALRRIILALIIAALMAAVMSVMAAPAFAKGNPTSKDNPYALVGTEKGGGGYVYTYKAPPAKGEPAPGSDASGGNPGYVYDGHGVYPGSGN